jgi:hypothetical protein
LASTALHMYYFLRVLQAEYIYSKVSLPEISRVVRWTKHVKSDQTLRDNLRTRYNYHSAFHRRRWAMGAIICIDVIMVCIELKLVFSSNQYGIDIVTSWNDGNAVSCMSEVTCARKRAHLPVILLTSLNSYPSLSTWGYRFWRLWVMIAFGGKWQFSTENVVGYMGLRLNRGMYYWG